MQQHHSNSSTSFLSDNNDKASNDFKLERRETAFTVIFISFLQFLDFSLKKLYIYCCSFYYLVVMENTKFTLFNTTYNYRGSCCDYS